MAACRSGSSQALSQHLEDVIKFCSEQEFVQAEAIGLETLTVEFTCAKNQAVYSFNFTPDYPDNTVVSCSHDCTNVNHSSLALPALFSGICREWCLDNGQTVPSLPSTDLCSTLAPLTDFQRQITTGSTMSAASSEYTEGSDVFSDDMMDYYDETISTTDSVHCLLERDIACVAAKYGQNAIDHRVHAGINEMDIIMYIDLSFLDSHTASAWNVRTNLPMVIQIHLQSASDYLDGPTPTVEVYQGTIIDKNKHGLAGQIQKVMQTYLSTQWRNMSNRQLQEHIDSEAVRKQAKQIEVATPTNPNSALFFSGAEMGEEALSEDPDQAITPTVSMKDPLGATEESQSLPTPTASQKDPLGCSYTTELPLLSRQDSHGAQIVLPSTPSDRPEDSKTLPPLDDGFLAQSLQYALNRIPLLNEFCVICDERHILGTSLIRPCVCTRELCVFAFQTLYVMCDSADSIATDGSVIDLLIAMVNAAANSKRVTLILDPYPSIVNPSKRSELAMDPKAKDFELVRDVVHAVINARQMYVRGRCASTSLKQEMDIHHPLAFPLMQWIVSSNRSHIVLLPEEKRLPSMITKYQFLLISSPPAKEAAFQQAKSKYGSTYAFHGSGIENWHSIMRKGLINASGTKFQMNGAAYGNGIYLSPNSATSFGYSSRHAQFSPSKGDDTLAGKKNINCMALCEVVTNKDLRKNTHIWVCSNPDNVVTRFFFVYESHLLLQNYPDTSDIKFRQEIISALKK